MRRVVKAGLAGLAAWLGAACGPAAAFVQVSGTFVAAESCPALESIRREANPGAVRTAPGQSYAVRGLNREDGDYVQVDVPNAEPRARWVSVACGKLARNADPGRRAPSARPDPDLAPFFDENDQPNDPAPRPPALSAFDRAMLGVCGPWGSNPRQEAFRTALDDAALAPDVERIFAALAGSVLGPRRESAAFKDELASVWFAEGGFRHVFCGEPSGGTIGGLHFAGRYLEMQQEGWGGLADRCEGAEIAPPIYTIGVRYRIARGGWRVACRKGYALSLDASEILVEATRALKLMLPRASGKAMCLHKVEEPKERAFLAVFVIKNRAVRTFYPDASPSCDGGRRAQECLCAP